MSPFSSERWKSSNSPWSIQVMNWFPDNRIKKIVVKCSAQSSKTQTVMCCLCWIISEDPGPAMWVLAAADEAKQFFRDRLGPTFEKCKPVQKVFIKQDEMDFIFATMPLYFTGAGSKSKLQGKPIRWLLLDEVRNYPKGALTTVLKRTRAHWNQRTVIISTPGVAKDEMDLEFKAGTQHTYFFPCPSCHQYQKLVFEQLKWTKNSVTKPEGSDWIMNEVVKTIRYECAACGHAIHDTPEERRYITDSGRFIPQNPDAKDGIKSIQWNAMLPIWVIWGDVVYEYLEARKAAKGGNIEPMRTFYCETLGESWVDELGVIEDYGFLEDRKQEYDYGDDWAEEITRFMAADKQSAGGEHYWWVIRAFGRFGKSRLISYGRCNTYAELEEIRASYGVNVRNAMIDSGYKANEVYRFCIATGWKPFKGDQADYFLVKDEESGKTFRRCWSWTWAKPEGVRPVKGLSKRIRLFRFSGSWIGDLLGEYMTGLAGEWSLPTGIGKDYRKQMISERRELVIDSAGYSHYRWRQVFRDNHLLDCERMIKAAAVISKVITSGKQPTVREPKRKAA